MTTQNAIKRLSKAGMSRADISKRLGCTRAAVSHWATGRSVPSSRMLKELVKLAEEHGVVLLASDFGKRD